MKSLNLLIVFTLQLTCFCTLISAKTESLATAAAVPFQLISPAEYKAILELSNGNPFITQNRLLNSGSQVVTDIINNIVNGLISPVNITGLAPIYNSILKPTSGKAQGYPFCAIQTNRNTQHSQRSYDAVVDPSSNFGTFSINFYQHGTVNIDNYDEDISIDEVEPDYHNQKPSSLAGSSVPSSIAIPTTAVKSGSSADANKDKPDNFAAPVINCILVLKEPSQPATPPPTTTPTPAPTHPSAQRPHNRPSMRPSFYPQFPSIVPPHHHPQDPNYSIGPYQIVPIPYPPFLGLIGPASGTPVNWPNWPGSQALGPNNPSSTITPTWPSSYWSIASPTVASQGNKNPQTAPTWPYLAIPSQPATTHVPATSPYMPSSFWTSAINPDAGNPGPSPSISIHSNQNAWFRPPPAGALFNPNHLLQQQLYNENADEIRSVAINDEISPENTENQVLTLIGDEHVVDTIQRSHKQQSRRLGAK